MSADLDAVHEGSAVPRPRVAVHDGSFELERSREEPTAFRIVVTGAMDHSNVAAFDRLTDALLVDAARFVVVDLAGVTFLDSSGLRGLVRARQLLAEHHGRLTCSGMSRAVREVLTLAGLLEILTDAGADDH